MNLKCSQNLLSNFQQLKRENSPQMDKVQSKIQVIKIWQFTFKPDRLFIEPDDLVEIQVIDLSNNIQTGIYSSRFIYLGIEEIGIQSPKLFKGDKYNFTLKNPGQYELNCLNIPKMKCLITVKNIEKKIKDITEEKPIDISPQKIDHPKIDQFAQKKLQLLNEIQQQEDLQVFTQQLGIQDNKILQLKINQLQEEEQSKKKAILDQIQINQDIEQLKKNDFFINQNNYKIMVNKGQNSENQLDLYKPIQDDLLKPIQDDLLKPIQDDLLKPDDEIKKQKAKQKKKQEKQKQQKLEDQIIQKQQNNQGNKYNNKKQFNNKNQFNKQRKKKRKKVKRICLI